MIGNLLNKPFYSTTSLLPQFIQYVKAVVYEVHYGSTPSSFNRKVLVAGPWSLRKF